MKRNIRAYDVDHDGEVSNERVTVSHVDGIPDGIRTGERAICMSPPRALRFTARKESCG